MVGNGHYLTLKDACRQADYVEAVSRAPSVKYKYTFSMLKALLMSIRCYEHYSTSRKITLPSKWWKNDSR